MPVASQRAPSNAPSGADREIEVSKFWVTRSGEALITKIVFFNDRPFLDVRRHYTDKAGKFAPTRKGFTIALRKLPHLLKAIAKAEREARTQGLLGQDGGAA